MKLKKGDRVVFVDERIAGTGFPHVGDRGVVVRIEKYSSESCEVEVKFDVDNGVTGTVFSHRYQLESIYDSPLNKALRENDGEI